MEKPVDVKIESISAASVPIGQGQNTVGVFGLGSDGLVYQWIRRSKNWVLYEQG